MPGVSGQRKFKSWSFFRADVRSQYAICSDFGGGSGALGIAIMQSRKISSTSIIGARVAAGTGRRYAATSTSCVKLAPSLLVPSPIVFTFEVGSVDALPSACLTPWWRRETPAEPAWPRRISEKNILAVRIGNGQINPRLYAGREHVRPCEREELPQWHRDLKRRCIVATVIFIPSPLKLLSISSCLSERSSVKWSCNSS
jgi:hypothetical protein